MAHGSTPAAWTAVGTVILAFVVGGIGLVIGPNWLVFWIGVALLPVGAILGKLLQAMGLGQTRHQT